MVIVRRDNNSLRCKVAGNVSTWRDLTTFLTDVKKLYESEGWKSCWDDEHFKTGLLLWNEQESLYYGPYFKRTPRDASKEFVW